MGNAVSRISSGLGNLILPARTLLPPTVRVRAKRLARAVSCGRLLAPTEPTAIETDLGNHVDLLASLERCSTQAASALPARCRRGWPGAITLAGRHMRLLCSSSMT